jgi:hypothetical protein
MAQRTNATGLTNTNILQYDSGFANSGVISAGPGSLQSLIIASKLASGNLSVQIFDSATVPSNGAVPIIAPIIVGANQTVQINFSQGVSSRQWDGLTCSAGIAWGASTTPATLTQDATSSIWVSAKFVS